MDKFVIFYDDRKNSCINCAEKFGQYENVECRKISDYQDQSLVYANGARVGLIFESENGKLPYGVSHIIWKIVADKNRNHMILITGGSRELKAARAAVSDLDERGYHILNLYTRYVMEKNKITPEEAVEWILKDIETEKPKRMKEWVKEKYQGMSRRELRKELHRELKEYREYQKKQIKIRKQKLS